MYSGTLAWPVLESRKVGLGGTRNAPEPRFRLLVPIPAGWPGSIAHDDEVVGAAAGQVEAVQHDHVGGARPAIGVHQAVEVVDLMADVE